MPLLFGEHNAHLQQIEEALGIDIASRGNSLSLNGTESAVHKAEIVLNALWHKLEQNQVITKGEVDAALRFAQSNSTTQIDPIITAHKNPVSPRTPTQADYVQAMRKHDMVLAWARPEPERRFWLLHWPSLFTRKEI